jgi:hypothetical protein
VLQADSLDELVALGTRTAQAARFLEAAVVSGLNVLVAGGIPAGKTMLLPRSYASPGHLTADGVSHDLASRRLLGMAH